MDIASITDALQRDTERVVFVNVLFQQLESPQPPLLLDQRGAMPAEHDFLHDAVGGWPKERPIVTLCACSEEAGAIQAACRLLADGYLSVRPLRGGYQAWLAATGGEAAEA